MYKLNIEYIGEQAKELNRTGECDLIQLLEYNAPLPSELAMVFNPNWDSLGFGFPVGFKQMFMRKHEENFIEHIRFEAFKRKNESFTDCNNRLISDLLETTGLPLYLESPEK